MAGWKEGHKAACAFLLAQKGTGNASFSSSSSSAFEAKQKDTQDRTKRDPTNMQKRTFMRRSESVTRVVQSIFLDDPKDSDWHTDREELPVSPENTSATSPEGPGTPTRYFDIGRRRAGASARGGGGGGGRGSEGGGRTMSPFAHERDDEARWKESERESARARDERHSLRVSTARSQVPRPLRSVSDSENSRLVRRSHSKEGESRGEAGRQRGGWEVGVSVGGEAGRERGEREGGGRSLQRSHSREAARMSFRSHAGDSFSRAHDFAGVDTRTHEPTLSSSDVFQRRASG